MSAKIALIDSALRRWYYVYDSAKNHMVALRSATASVRQYWGGFYLFLQDIILVIKISSDRSVLDLRFIKGSSSFQAKIKDDRIP